MKELVDLRDYLVTAEEVGDWFGDEQLVADRLNELYHLCWTQIPEDTAPDKVRAVLDSIWEQIRGDLTIVEAEPDELHSWLSNHVENWLNSHDSDGE
ncbi:hypothetical protein [Algicola sagamiensis]|uniref:hypothetical protein n=1 Tax=Algicola sagamiensis TaxID=163869 RepID=UPI000365EAB2|nr:hypothetical protein [Algicola sagamiensis]